MMSPRNKINKMLRRHDLDTSVQSSPGASRIRSETGETLVEVLLALIILALASVALITAFGTDISASTEHRSLANFDTALASSIAAVTSIMQEPQYDAVFETCPDPNNPLAQYPSSAVLTQALNINGFTAAIGASGTTPAVQYSSGGTFSATCSDGTNSPTGNVGQPQLITVVVTDTLTGSSQSFSVVAVNPVPVQVGDGNGTAATQLKFASDPEGATVGTPFQTQPILEVLDGNGKIVTTDLSPITLTLTGGTNGAALSSTCSGVETSGVVVYSGCSINEIGTGYSLTASEPSPTNPGETLTSTSAPFTVYPGQLSTPTITQVIPSTVTAGAINITFTGTPNAQNYTVKACTDHAMSANCSAPMSIAPGSTDLTGLVPGDNYYVQITAQPPLVISHQPRRRPTAPTMATVQLLAPTNVTLGYGSTAGSLSSLHRVRQCAQSYTVKACTNTAMQNGCVSNANFSPGSNLTGTSGPATRTTSRSRQTPQWVISPRHRPPLRRRP